MQKENEKEFALLRTEMLNVKGCITQYLGYVFAGSGAAVYGIARMNQSADSTYGTAMATLAFAISFIISLVALVLFYKFHSHNRFAGYCKLLNHERYEVPPSFTRDSFYSWELAVGRLRCMGKDEKSIKSLVEPVNLNDKIKKDKLEKYLLSLVEDDKKRIRSYCKGTMILLKALYGKIETNSWGYPPLVTSICFIFSFGFLFSGHFLRIQKCSTSKLLFLISIAITIIQLFLWMRLSGKLYSLMAGSTTVQSFFWKFLPIRASYLTNYDITPYYLDAENIDGSEAAILCPKTK